MTLDLLPDWEQQEVLDWLRQRRDNAGSREAGTLLTGALHSRLGQMICKAAGFTNQSAANLSDGDLRRIAARTKDFALPITGVCGFDQAQVTAGGLRCDEFDPRTMESRLVPGFTPAARCWILTATAAGIICNGRGAAGELPG